MTGFGDATCEVDSVHYAVELRSLNNRYFKATIRLPEPISVLEAELEPFLRRRLTRGSITLIVAFKDTSASAAYELNEEALQHYLRHLQHAEQQMQSAGEASRRLSLDLAALVSLPGVIQPPDQTRLVERCRPIIIQLVEQSCDKLMEMRHREGQGLLDDLREHRRYIAERLDQICQRAPHVLEEYHQRLRGRVDEMLARANLKVDEVDLIREVAVYADRCDVAEEVQRLAAHLDQFDEIIGGTEVQAAGRTLDFVAQEMLREANTIGSKSNDATISRIIVEVKGAIDRIKEQVQNVE